jgi:putative transposase
MARPLRIEFEHALYHVASRGNRRQKVFRDDRDYGRRLEWLRRTVETYGWRVHAFALMPNHDHLFVETPQANLSDGMQYLNGSYTSYFNRRHNQVGHLFQGRFEAVLIEDEGHYWEISRYIHLNPVRAGLAKRPEEWSWSSYQGYHRPRLRLSWVTYDRVLREFGRDSASAMRRYRQFMTEGIDAELDSPLERAAHGLLLGSDAFVTRMQRLIEARPADPAVPTLGRLRSRPAMTEIVAATAKAFNADASRWVRGCRDDAIGRSAAAWLGRCRFGYPAKTVAEALGYRGASSVSQALRRIEQEMKRIGPTLDRLGRTLTND